MDAKSYLQNHLDAFRRGDRDSAFFGLINRGVDLLPDLVNAFQSETEPQVRAFIIEVLWQQRDEKAIPILADALQDCDDRVWREAINGLVALGSAESIEALKMARSRVFLMPDERQKFGAWLEEAIQQIQKP